MSACLQRLACPSSLSLAAFLWLLVAPGVALCADDKAKAGEPAKKAASSAKTESPAPGVKAAQKPEAAKPADQKERPQEVSAHAEAVADPKHDRDFAIQGEFVGPATVGPGRYQPVALQVRPLGEGGFEAIQYQGGLPGERSHRPTPVTLIGKRSADFLVLSGGPWAVFVEPDHCLLVDREGRPAGRLERVVRQSPTLGAKPPKDAIVLFDGQNTDQLINGRMTEDGLLMQGADVKPMVQDFNLHAEFMLPYMPAGRDQGRGNSGLYLLSRYEVQILDSFAGEPVYNGCGSLYRLRKPDLNMCLPPLAWQTYDIMFTAPRWAADGTKMKNARITVWQNGVKIHNNVELADKTGAGKAEEPTLLPIKIQDHKNPVRFRNIWIVDRGAAPAGNFPVLAKAGAPKKAAPKKETPKKEAADRKAGDKIARPTAVTGAPPQSPSKKP